MGLRRLKNGNVIQKAIELDCALITFDKDFKYLKKYEIVSIDHIKVHPNNDRNVVPRLKRFFDKNKDNKLLGKYVEITNDDEHFIDL